MLLLQVELLTGTRRVSFARLASKVSHSIASHNVPCTLEKESRSEWLVGLSSEESSLKTKLDILGVCTLVWSKACT